MPGARGRPVATSHAAIEQAAFELFAARGFAKTTLGDIAEAVGVGRRTVSRYYASKNDIPWGQFDVTLEMFAGLLDATPSDVALIDAIHRGILAFNDFPADARPPHRERMRLILGTPELQAHSVHKYREWREVIARFVAGRCGLSDRHHVPQLIGHVALALAITSYEQWLERDGSDLLKLLDESLDHLRRFAAP